MKELDKKIGSVALSNMRAVERALVRTDSYCTRLDLQRCIASVVGNKSTVSERTVQLTIRNLKEWYSNNNSIETYHGDQAGPKYHLKNKYFLCFPEVIYDDKDQDVMRLLLQIAALYNLPVKDFADKMKDVIEYNRDVSESLSINSEAFPGFNKLFNGIFVAIFRKKTILVNYTPFNKPSVQYTISPLILKMFNERWYLIAHIHEPNSFDWSVLPLDRIISVSEYSGNKTFSNISVSQIKEYYDKVIGFQVPWDKIRGNNPDNPKRVQRASDLMTTSICLRVDNEKTYKYIKNKPFHNSQRANDTTHQITLELVENDTLYKRFMEFGAEITVISPESVRNTLAERARLIYENLINPQLDCG